MEGNETRESWKGSEQQRSAGKENTKANRNLDDEQADEFRKKKEKIKQNLSKKDFTKSCPPKKVKTLIVE